MGATTDDYSTLSSQNYLMFALALLNRTTGKAIYCSELREVRRFVEDYLFDPAQGRLLHHWIDGDLVSGYSPWPDGVDAERIDKSSNMVWEALKDRMRGAMKKA